MDQQEKGDPVLVDEEVVELGEVDVDLIEKVGERGDIVVGSVALEDDAVLPRE